MKLSLNFRVVTESSFLRLYACVCVKKHLGSSNVIFSHVFSLQRCSGTHSLSSLSLCLLISDVTRHQVCTGGLWEAVQTNHWPGFLSKENKPSR